MKRLISWLLALTMIMSLPLSAFAAGTDVEVGEGGSDVEVGFEELLPGYSADNRLTVAWTWNKTQTEAMAQVTVPAGKTMYFEYQGDPSFALFVNGEEYEFTAAQGRTDTNKFQITNSTDAEVTYELGLKQPVGSYNNPEKITELDYYTVNQAAGDNDGYCYTYTATETGTITFYFTEVPGTEDEYDENGEIIVAAKKYTCDISVTNMRNSSQKTLLVDGVDNFGLELTVNVNAGDELLINVAAVKDLEGNFYPEAIMTWYGAFAYPAGSELNPITIEWTWDDAYANATATVTVEADGTYFNGNAGMILTVDGVETAQENGVFVLNAGTYELALATPVGAYNNPEVIENIDGYTDSNSLEADGSYYYIWTATEDGTVTLDITDGANIVVDHITGVSEDGWPISVQSQLAEPEEDENYNYIGWTVAENLVIEVKAGEQLKIQVNALTDWATSTTPAIEYTLTGSFEKAGCEHDYTGENGACINCGEYQVDETLEFYSMSMVLGADIRGIFMFRKYKATSPYESFKVVVEKNGVETELELAATSEKTSYIQYGYALTVPAKEMADVVKARIVGIKADGTYYVSNPVDWSIKIGAISLMDGYAAKTDANSQNRLKMIANMLHYGAEAQKRFGYNLDNLATDGLSEAYTSLIIKTPPTLNSMPTIDDTGVTSTLKGIAFNLDAKAEIVVMFKVPKADAKEIYSADIVQTHTAPDGTVSTKNYTIDGADCLKSSTTFGVYINNLESDEMRDILSVTLKKNGEVVSATHTFSGESALVGGLLNTYPDLANALMNYADCAYAVFGNSPLA